MCRCIVDCLVDFTELLWGVGICERQPASTGTRGTTGIDFRKWTSQKEHGSYCIGTSGTSVSFLQFCCAGSVNGFLLIINIHRSKLQSDLREAQHKLHSHTNGKEQNASPKKRATSFLASLLSDWFVLLPMFVAFCVKMFFSSSCSETVYRIMHILDLCSSIASWPWSSVTWSFNLLLIPSLVSSCSAVSVASLSNSTFWASNSS